MSKLSPRCPVNASADPSGDHPCQYEGAFVVIWRGVPPAIGNVYTMDLSVSDESLMAILVPSGEMP
jgi:hypothetical protein